MSAHSVKIARQSFACGSAKKATSANANATNACHLGAASTASPCNSGTIDATSPCNPAGETASGSVNAICGRDPVVANSTTNSASDPASANTTSPCDPASASYAASSPITAKSVKAQLRAQCKAQRASMPPDERASADACIAERVYHLPAWKRAQVVFAYLSFGSEVNTHAIIRRAWSEGKRVALPRCVPKSRLLTWHYVTSFDALEKSTLGVREPAYDTSTLVNPAACDPKRTLALVPGLTFDSCGLRLGYGGGFYDTFLAQFSGTSVGLCRKQQLYRSLREQGAIEAHDSPVDVVVTDA